MNPIQQATPNHKSETLVRARHSISNAKLFPQITQRFRPANVPAESVFATIQPSKHGKEGIRSTA